MPNLLFDRENAREKPVGRLGRLPRGKPELQVETREPGNRWVASMRLPETAARVPIYKRCNRKTLADRDAKARGGVRPSAGALCLLSAIEQSLRKEMREIMVLDEVASQGGVQAAGVKTCPSFIAPSSSPERPGSDQETKCGTGSPNLTK